jgi:1,4-alpha-glucan branching enzyme
MRKGRSKDDIVVIVCNFTPETLLKYRIGMPSPGLWREVLISNAKKYYGSGQGNRRALKAAPKSMHGRPYSITLTLPPLAAVFLKETG